MKTLVAGWFSFVEGHATAGDLLARDVACRWLEEAGQRFDIALAPSSVCIVRWASGVTRMRHLPVGGPDDAEGVSNATPAARMSRRNTSPSASSRILPM